MRDQISAALIFVLAQHYKDSAFAGTRSMLLRLMLLSLESGASESSASKVLRLIWTRRLLGLITTVVAVAALITFVGSTETNAGLAIGASQMQQIG
jgi:hypothetical protein